MRTAIDVAQQSHSDAAQGFAAKGGGMAHTSRAAVRKAVDGALRRLVVPFIAALAIAVATEDASAQNVERSGKEVVEASCFA